ncbi:hypothetical protein [Cerasicoccus maritimus]|uniref:hypothetical protein n=1 Tax=Cerasicoccus maritimus TaxID=490089 RepID=UPI002852854A|nr:hypothetical protein [Cerasicoccus maritimus]
MPEALPNIRELIPHEPPLVLVDRLNVLNQEQVCGETTLAPGTLDDSGQGVPAAWSLEIVAQACAAIIGHEYRDRGYQGGRLIRAPRWDLAQTHLPTGQTLTIEATLEAASGLGIFLFNGRLLADGQALAEGQLTILAQ